MDHVMNLVQSTVRRLHRADTVLRIEGSLRKTPDLLPHLLGNSQPCRIISSPVDLVAGRQLLCSLGLRAGGQSQHSIRIHGRKIMLYYHSHIFIPP